VNQDYTLKPVAEAPGGVDHRPVRVRAGLHRPLRRPTSSRQSLRGSSLLENLRFHAEEEKNDPVFAKALADLATCM